MPYTYTYTSKTPKRKAGKVLVSPKTHTPGSRLEKRGEVLRSCAQVVKQIMEVCETDPIESDLALMVRGHVNTGKLIIRGQPGLKNAILKNLMAKKHGVMLNGPTGVQVIPDLQGFIAQ